MVILRLDCIYIDFSVIVLIVNKRLMVERFGLNTACSSLSLTDFLSISVSMLHKTLSEINSNVISCQLLLSERLPLFGSFFFHDSFLQLLGWLYLTTPNLMRPYLITAKLIGPFIITAKLMRTYWITANSISREPVA